MLEVREWLRQGAGYGVDPERQEQIQALRADVKSNLPGWRLEIRKQCSTRIRTCISAAEP